MVEINLLPAQYRKRNEPNAWRYASMALVPLTVLGLLIPSVVIGTIQGNVQRELDATNGQLTALQPAKREYDDLNRQKTELQQVTAVADTLQASKTYWSSDLARMINALPSTKGVALTTLTMRTVDSNTQTNHQQQGLYDGKMVSKEFDLTGQASSTQTLVEFLNAFENNPNFGVNFRSAQRGEAGASSTGTEPYTFNATVGLVSQAATPSTPSTPVQSSTGAGTGGQN
ncbi:fimbrial assembly protein [Deinococcus sonorensis]|uniref:Fimbrial assembly protein n=2 Tax=Deinococcus sonorensis TaxID=309891 RepID=A0AAU7U756_9DEIO